jgi:methylenetetrahydrofolate reductase (NADPH)
VTLIRSRHPSLGIGVAAYPEGHPEAPSAEQDLAFLKRKLDLGADFAITQLFFDNSVYLDFTRRARAAGIAKPLIPGILPILNLGTIDRLISKCGAHLPPDYLSRLEDAHRRGGPAAVAEVGIAYAKAQARDLLESGAPGVHLYTLNKAEACLEIVNSLGLGENRGRER